MSDRAGFFDDQNVELADVEYIEEQRVEEQDLRFSEIAGSFGILIGLELANPAAFMLSVGAGVAYDILGNTLRVITGDTNPLRAAPLTLGFLATDAGKLITLAYAEGPVETGTHPVTGATPDIRFECYPTVQLRTSPVGNEIVIGSIDQIDISGVCTFDLATAQYWGARLTPQQLADLATALFEVTSHQYTDHVSGIEVIGSGGDPGAIVIDASTTPDRANVTNLVSKDSILVNGRRLASAGALSNTLVTFIDPAVTAAPQVWAIHVNNEGVVGKTLAAQYGAAQVITGLQIVDLCPFGIPWPDLSLTIDHFKPGAAHFLRIAGNVTVSPTADGLYLLRTNSDPDKAVMVYVTIGALPTGGTDGTPNQDVIAIDPSIYDRSPGFPQEFGADNPPVTVADDVGNAGCFFLGYLWWYGTGLNLLGYGTWATTGIAHDKRSKGNLHSVQVSDAFKTRMDRLLDETRAWGFVGPPLLLQATGLSVPIPTSLQVAGFRSDFRNDISDFEKSVYAYINGRRVRVPTPTTLTLPANTTRVIYLEDNGNGTSSWGFQSGSGSIGVPLTSTRMPCWNVTTGPTGVTSFEDITVTLPRIDREAVRLNRRNVGDVELVGNFDLDGVGTFQQSAAFLVGISVAGSAAMGAQSTVGAALFGDDVFLGDDKLILAGSIVVGQKSIAKAWVDATISGVATTTVHRSRNCTASHAGTTITVTFAPVMATVFYAVNITAQRSSQGYTAFNVIKAVGSMTFQLQRNDGTTADPNVDGGIELDVTAFE